MLDFEQITIQYAFSAPCAGSAMVHIPYTPFQSNGGISPNGRQIVDNTAVPMVRRHPGECPLRAIAIFRHIAPHYIPFAADVVMVAIIHADM